MQELNEPIILFGEGKPDRRERYAILFPSSELTFSLRRVMFEQGVTEGMPTTVRRSTTAQAGMQEEQTEIVATLGPKVGACE